MNAVARSQLPGPIQNFERLWFLSMLVYGIVAVFDLNPATKAITEQGIRELVVVGGYVASVALMSWIILSATRRRRRWAKWLLIILGFGNTLLQLLTSTTMVLPLPFEVLSWVAVIPQAAGAFLLLSEDGRAWFKPVASPVLDDARPELPQAATAQPVLPQSQFAHQINQPGWTKASYAFLFLLIGMGVGGYAFYRNFVPELPTCGSEIVARTLRDIVVTSIEKSDSHKLLLIMTKGAHSDLVPINDSHRFDFSNYREQSRRDAIRSCSVDLRFGYERQWLLARIRNSSLSAEEKAKFGFAAPIAGINLGERLIKLDFTVQLNEQGQVYVEVLRN